MTQTADVDACPGKCIHALASLLCGQVREDIQCPSSSMRCCVSKPRKKKKPKTTTVKTTTVKTTTVKVKKVKKTKLKSTTERTIEQTTRKQVSSNI